MRLGNKILTVGDKRLITVDYAQWLPAGVTLESATVTDNSASTTISAVTTHATHLTFLITVSAAAAANELFTLAVQVVDSLTQIKNDTIDCIVVEP